MSHANYLRSVAIESPCSASWDEMAGNEKVRACEHCQLSVQDLSQMTAAKAFKLVRSSKGRLCLRIHRTPAGEIITRPVYEKLHAITRRTSRIAAGAFTAVMGLSTAAYAQSSGTGNLDQNHPVAAVSANTAALGPSGWLTGRALDQNEAVIPGATVQVTNEQTGEVQTLTTNEEGVFRIWLPGGYSYQTEISSPGFARATTQKIALDPSGETRIDVTLNVGAVMGAIAITRSYEQPLVMAASQDDLDAVKQLLRNGADANQTEEDGTSALELAVSNGNYKMVRALLRAGANVGPAGETGSTILFSLNDSSEPKLISLLVKYGANVNQANANGDTPLISAAEWDSAELVQALIRAGASVNAQNRDGNSALMIAAQEGHAETVEALLAAGAIYGLRNAAGEDALFLAVAAENDDVCELLRAAGAVDPVR